MLSRNTSGAIEFGHLQHQWQLDMHYMKNQLLSESQIFYSQWATTSNELEGKHCKILGRLRRCQPGIVDIPLEACTRKTACDCKAQQLRPSFVYDSNQTFIVFHECLILYYGVIKDSSLQKLGIDYL